MKHSDMDMKHSDMDMKMEHSTKKMDMKNPKQKENNHINNHMHNGKLTNHFNEGGKPTPTSKIIQRESSINIGTTMRTMSPQYRLDDPGVGLRNNGRKVLTYANLQSLKKRKYKKPNKELTLRLTGNMERYMWSINGIPYAKAKPIMFNYKDRINITFINDTMMNHPMHLHGMWSDLQINDNKDYFPRKHTVIVQPGSKLSIHVDADAIGVWAFHCHLLYHMSDMFRKVIVS
jgi:FtsP/CotA-like multicopper oxidase with cupredoxin domain